MVSMIIVLTLVILVVIFWVCGNIVQGRSGRAFHALRTSETAARPRLDGDKERNTGSPIGLPSAIQARKS